MGGKWDRGVAEGGQPEPAYMAQLRCNFMLMNSALLSTSI